MMERMDRPHLAVLIHGLNGKPSDLVHHHERFAQTHAVFRPAVVERGNCKLSVAVAPILDVIMQHASRHPNGTVTLVGLSNGGRIASKIEMDMRGHPTPVFTVTIAAPLLGAPLIDSFVGCVAGAVGWYSWDVIEELKPKNAIPITFQLPAGTGNRQWCWYAGEDDCMVPVHLATNGGKGFIVPEHCHVSVSAATAYDVYAAGLLWIESQIACEVCDGSQKAQEKGP